MAIDYSQDFVGMIALPKEWVSCPVVRAQIERRKLSLLLPFFLLSDFASGLQWAWGDCKPWVHMKPSKSLKWERVGAKKKKESRLHKVITYHFSPSILLVFLLNSCTCEINERRALSFLVQAFLSIQMEQCSSAFQIISQPIFHFRSHWLRIRLYFSLLSIVFIILHPSPLSYSVFESLAWLREHWDSET